MQKKPSTAHERNTSKDKNSPFRQKSIEKNSTKISNLTKTSSKISSQNNSKKNSFEKNSNDLNSFEFSENILEEDEKPSLDNYNILGLIGRGSFGEVFLVHKKGSDNMYAMKVLSKTKIQQQNLLKYALAERNVLSVLNHPFIVKLNAAFQTNDRLFLIMDYCPRGDMSKHLQKEKRFSEERTKIYVAQILLALEELHRNDIIFRDLKPENIVIDDLGHAMLTDFGLSKEGIIDPTIGAKSFCGSIAYLAPEMLKRTGHGKAVDWYLLGVVMYELLVGTPPYYAQNRDQLFYNIVNAPLKIPNHLSNEAKLLLKGLLERNPAKRLGSSESDSEEIKEHPFFRNINWNAILRREIKMTIPEYKIKIDTQKKSSLPKSNSKEINEYISGWSFAQNYN